MEPVQNFGASFKQFMDKMIEQAPEKDYFFPKLLESHFCLPLAGLPIVSETYPNYELANLHLAVEAFRNEEAVVSRVLGIQGERFTREIHLTSLIVKDRMHDFQEGPVQYNSIHIDETTTVNCLRDGLILLEDKQGKAVLLLTATDMFSRSLTLEVMANNLDHAQGILRYIRETIRNRNIYRGRILSLEKDQHESINLKVHCLPEVKRSDLILPAGLLERIERLTIRFGELREDLRTARRHLRRGILLHGAPGTGKTFTLMYLVSAMKDRTVFLTTGSGLYMLESICSLARLLQPSLVVLEDVDMIAQERSRQRDYATPLLFELLNQMDGMNDDMDVLFVLTTNRPDILEPALAARPGRIDQAIEIPLPDADSRRRLIELYGWGMDLDLRESDRFIARTEGASGAFIKELLRRAALIALDQRDGNSIKDWHLEEAMKDLIIQGGNLTRSFLGFLKDKNKPEAD